MLEGPDGQVEHTAAQGNGPVNALDQALRKALAKFYPEVERGPPARLQGPRARQRRGHGGARPRADRVRRRRAALDDGRRVAQRDRGVAGRRSSTASTTSSTARDGPARDAGARARAAASVGRAVRIYLDHNASAPLRPEARDGDARGRSSRRQSVERASRGRAGARRGRAARADGRGAGRRGAGRDRLHERRHRGEQPGAARRAAARPRRAGHDARSSTPRSSRPRARSARRGSVVVGVDARGPGRRPTTCVAPAAPGTALVSVGLANGEVGSVAPVGRRSPRALRRARRPSSTPTPRRRSAASRSTSRAPRRRPALALGAQARRTRTGVGALWVRRGVALAPLADRRAAGARPARRHRERRRRSSASASRRALARAELAAAGRASRALRDRLWDGHPRARSRTPAERSARTSRACRTRST